MWQFRKTFITNTIKLEIDSILNFIQQLHSRISFKHLRQCKSSACLYDRSLSSPTHLIRHGTSQHTGEAGLHFMRSTENIISTENCMKSKTEDMKSRLWDWKSSLSLTQHPARLKRLFYIPVFSSSQTNLKAKLASS